MTRRSLFSIRKLVLLTLNLASTILTLLTGLRENPVIVFVTGRYDHIRERLIGGTINYDNIRDDTVSREMLPDFKEVGKSYRLISSPRRSPENLAEDRSTCMYVNSLNASFYSLNYDDFWGKGARRAQIFMHSISAPHCNVINLKPEWYNDTCIASVGNGNATACHYYILDNFDAIKRDYTLQVGQQGGFGVIGVPLLKCLGRPEMKFHYYTDLIIEQQYWSGGSYHVEIQSSKCFALPLVRDHEWRWSLFQVDRLDYAANVVTAIDSSGWFVLLVTTLYGIVTIALILHGILASILRVRTVRYLPKAERFIKEYRILKYIFPFMMAARTVTDNANHVITFKGSLFMASDVWMNHWLYIMLSIFDSVASIRAMYMVLEMGTWMLTMKLNFENFLFMCSALTRITWLLCCVHTVVRYALKLGLRSIKSMKVVRSAMIERLEWFVDAWALFMSYKIYSMLVCIVFVFSLQARGTTSFMKEAGTLGVFGGEPDITQFWGNEIMCDAVTILLIVFASGMGFTILMLQTKYRHVTQNGVIRLLQDRYIVVGWDVFVTLEALGIDPFNPDLVGDDGICRTNCSLGAILQQLYTSGLSGYVNLAADYLFLDNGFAQEPLKMRYPVKRAMAMDLCSSHRNTYTSGKATNDESVGVSTMRKDAAEEAKVMSAAICRTGPNAKSLFERRLKIVSEGYVGKIIFIDEDHPGHLVKSATSSLMEFEVQDALSTMSILDIKPLLGNEKKLHIH